jgi:hypothetical protein
LSERLASILKLAPPDPRASSSTAPRIFAMSASTITAGENQATPKVEEILLVISSSSPSAARTILPSKYLASGRIPESAPARFLLSARTNSGLFFPLSATSA